MTISTEHRLKRLLPRQFTNWRGCYMIEGDPNHRWRECRVTDISTAGAGLELLDATPEETQGQRIILGIELKAEVRYTREEADGELRAGIQFVELSDAEMEYLASLAELGGRW